MPMEFSDQELARVPAAIEAAETKTNAEIFAVLCEQSDDYRFVAYSFLALWIFLVSVILVLFALWQGWIGPSADWVSAPEVSNRGALLIQFVLAQVAALIGGIALFRIFPGLAVMVTPRRIAHERSRANGIKQFLAHGIDRTQGRTGVLIFVSLRERYGEIFVDAAIEEKVGREFFLEEIRVLIEHCARGEVIDGYVKIIEQLGERLSEAFPKTARDENELENRFVIL